MWLSILTSRYTWFAIGAAALLIVLRVAYGNYETMKAQAALVPGLRAQAASYAAQIKGADDRVAKALVDQQLADAQRDQAISDLGKWNDLKTGLDAKLEAMTKHASASTNAVCLPSPGERELWNTTLARLTGSDPGDRPDGTAGKMP